MAKRNLEESAQALTGFLPQLSWGRMEVGSSEEAPDVFPALPRLDFPFPHPDPLPFAGARALERWRILDREEQLQKQEAVLAEVQNRLDPHPPLNHWGRELETSGAWAAS